MEWQKAFNIPSQRLHQLKEWCLEEPKRSQQSLLYWALEHQLLPVKEYLTWAKQKHQIPLIKETFFFEQEPQNLSLWPQAETPLPWSKELVPLFQWKNHLFIACIEKPMEEWKALFERKGFHAQFVLGSIEGMKVWHKKLFSQTASLPVSTPLPPSTSSSASIPATPPTSAFPSTSAPPAPPASPSTSALSASTDVLLLPTFFFFQQSPPRQEGLSIGGPISATEAKKGLYKDLECGPAPLEVKEAFMEMEEKS